MSTNINLVTTTWNVPSTIIKENLCWHLQHRQNFEKVWKPHCLQPKTNTTTTVSGWYPILQKARIKVWDRDIYTYLFFSYKYNLLFCCKIKIVVIAVFLSKLDQRPLFHDIYNKIILVWGLVSIWLTNATYCLQYTPCSLKSVRFQSMFYQRLTLIRLKRSM